MTSKNKFCSLFSKSAKHLKISSSKISFSFTKFFNKEIKFFRQILKDSFFICELRYPKVTNAAFLISLFALLLRYLLISSKNLFKNFFAKISLFILYNSGIN